jgi:hypothetical protein
MCEVICKAESLAVAGTGLHSKIQGVWDVTVSTGEMTSFMCRLSRNCGCLNLLDF